MIGVQRYVRPWSQSLQGLFLGTIRSGRLPTVGPERDGVRHQHGINQGRPITTLLFPQEIPVLTPRDLAKETSLSACGHPIVVFDVETAGGEFYTSLVQLAAAGQCQHCFTSTGGVEGVSTGDVEDASAGGSDSSPATGDHAPMTTFTRYVIPTTRMSYYSSQVHGIQLIHGKLYRKGEVLPAKPLESVLKDFIAWLRQVSDSQPAMLVAHNCHQLDMRTMVNAFLSVGLEKELRECVVGFLDTLPPFKRGDFHCGASGVSLKAVHEHYVGSGVFDAHDAVSDVKALAEVIARVEMTPPVLDLPTALKYVKYRAGVVERLKTFKPALDGKGLKEMITARLADSGIAYADLMQVHIVDPESGVERYFVTPTGGKSSGARVTSVKRVARTLAAFLSRDMFFFARRQNDDIWKCFASFETPVVKGQLSSRRAFMLAYSGVDLQGWQQLLSQPDGDSAVDKVYECAVEQNSAYMSAVDSGGHQEVIAL